MPKKLTHQEFLNKLYESNEFYRQGYFEVISQYENYSTKIKVKDKYGVCITWYEMLVRKNYKPSILSAIDKHSYFLVEVKENNLEYRKGNFEITSKYKGRLHKVEVLDKYNCKHAIYASSLIEGAQPCIDTAISREDYFLKKLKIENRSIYDSVEIVGDLKTSDVPTIFKTKYGNIKVHYSEFFRKGYTNLSIRSALNKTDFWIKRAKDLLPNNSNTDYSEVKYTDNKSKVQLRCKKHDYIYKQRPSHHMSGVLGCAYCMTQTIMYNNDNFENHKEFFEDYTGYLYVLRLRSEEEDFYKVGITAENRVNYRLNQIKKDYNVEVLFLEKGLLTEKYNTEQQFLEEFSKYKYTPIKKFTGYTECLTVNPVAEYYNWFYNTYR